MSVKKAAYILLFYLALVFSSNAIAAGTIGSSPDQDQDMAHLQPKEHSTSQARHRDNSNRFRIPHQSESGINVLSRLSLPESLNELPDYSFGNVSKDSHPTYPVSFYCSATQNLERSLTIKKLIFPFHTFL